MTGGTLSLRAHLLPKPRRGWTLVRARASYVRQKHHRVGALRTEDTDGGRERTQPGRAPKVVKLFTNRPSLGFSDVSDLAAQQEIELSAAQLEKGEPIQLRCGAPALLVRLSTAIYLAGLLGA